MGDFICLTSGICFSSTELNDSLSSMGVNCFCGTSSIELKDFSDSSFSLLGSSGAASMELKDFSDSKLNDLSDDFLTGSSTELNGDSESKLDNDFSLLSVSFAPPSNSSSSSSSSSSP